MGRYNFGKDVGVVVASRNMSDMNERVPGHFAKPEEAHGHETRYFGKFLGVGTISLPRVFFVV